MALADRWVIVARMGATKSRVQAPARPRPPTAAVRIAALEEAVRGLSARVAALEAVRAPAAAAPDDAALRDTVLAAVGELDARHRYGGLVPLPDVRAELRRRGVSDDARVNDALDALERAWKIDLSVAQSPTQVADRAAGIERPGRGLLYYVARR